MTKQQTNELDDKLRLKADYARAYYQRNKERISNQRKALYQQNKDKVNAYKKAHRKANLESYLAHEAEQRVKHREKRNKYISEWQQTPRGREVGLKTSAKMRELYPERYKARYMLRNAVRLGKVIKEPCACGNEKVEGHHYMGYAPQHWYHVVWLCNKHHVEAHNVG